MRVSVSDVVSPSYFVATAAVALGFFKKEGIDAEFIQSETTPSRLLREGQVDLVGASPYIGLSAFPEWEGAKVLCALSQYTYWFLAMRADLQAKRGDVAAVKGHRISAAGMPGLTLKRLLIEAGIDFERDKVQIVPPPPHKSGNWARAGAEAIQEGLAEGYWGNGMRVAYGVRTGIATLLLDVRRGDGPPAARNYTFSGLVTSDRLIQERPEEVAAATRAVIKTQRALKADPSLATEVGKRMFPPEETEMIADLIARDTPFYDPHVSEEAIAGTSKFAQDMGLISKPIPYDRVVATQFMHLWDE